MKQIFVICLMWLPFSLPAAAAEHHNYGPMIAEILKLINQHRVAMHLCELRANERIAAAALQHSVDMATGKIPLGHDGFDNRMAELRVKLTQANAWAENVASGATTAEKVVDMWLHSPKHKENMEGDYNLTGIGISMGTDGTLYFTQIFFKAAVPATPAEKAKKR